MANQLALIGNDPSFQAGEKDFKNGAPYTPVADGVDSPTRYTLGWNDAAAITRAIAEATERNGTLLNW